MIIREIGKKAADENPPVGINPAELDEYAFIEDEIAKLTSPTASGSVDWEKVKNLSAGIISDKSKHFTVCCYLAASLTETGGLHGLADGIHVILDTVSNYWDDMYPPKKRMRGRLNSLGWLVERMQKYPETLNEEKWAKADYDGFKNDLESLDKFFSDNADGAPVLKTAYEPILALITVDEDAPLNDSGTTAETSQEAQAESAPEQNNAPQTEQTDEGADTEKEYFTVDESIFEPISDDAPFGGDLYDDEDFEALEDEISKLTSISSGNGADWDKILLMSKTLLTDKSKHFLVCNYYCTALLYSDGLDRIFESIKIMTDFADKYWDDMFPPKKRMKARTNACEWYIDKVKTYLNAVGTPVKWPQEKITQVMDEIDRLDSVMGEKSQSAPVFRTLKDNLENAVAAETENTAPKAPEPEPSTVETKKHETKSTDAASNIETPDFSDVDKDKVAEKVYEALIPLSEALSGVDKYHPEALRLTRISAWSGVENLPAAEGGKTMLPPPDKQFAELLQSNFASSRWEALFDTAESRVSQYLFWIDLSMYSATALRSLGKDNSAEAVETESGRFVSRLKGISDLTFSDGTPFVSDDARKWLSTLGTQSASANVQTQEYDTSDADELQKAGDADGALKLLFNRQSSAKDAREEIFYLKKICSLLMNLGKKKSAAAYADKIRITADRYKIDEWDKAQALDIYRFALSCFKFAEGEAPQTIISELEFKILRLTPFKSVDML